MVDRNELLRRLAGKAPTKKSQTRKARVERQMSRMSGIITSGVIVSDINHGAWSMVGQPPATDSPGEIKDYAFL